MKKNQLKALELAGLRVKYVWMVVGSNNPCDIRRYAYSHQGAITQLNHVNKRPKHLQYKDCGSKGEWQLFKLVKVNKRRAKA